MYFLKTQNRWKTGTDDGIAIRTSNRKPILITFNKSFNIFFVNNINMRGKSWPIETDGQRGAESWSWLKSYERTLWIQICGNKYKSSQNPFQRKKFTCYSFYSQPPCSFLYWPGLLSSKSFRTFTILYRIINVFWEFQNLTSLKRIHDTELLIKSTRRRLVMYTCQTFIYGRYY